MWRIFGHRARVGMDGEMHYEFSATRAARESYRSGAFALVAAGKQFKASMSTDRG